MNRGFQAAGCLLMTLALAISCRTTQPLLLGGKTVGFTDPFPVKFVAQQSVVMTFRPHWWWPSIRFTALGYTSVDRATGDLSLVCLSPLGIKLFEATRRSGVESTTVAFPVKGDVEAMKRAIGKDIGCIYSDLTPPPHAVLQKSWWGPVYAVVDGSKRTEWWYAVDTGLLLTKMEKEGNELRMVKFENYGAVGGVMCPKRIVFSNHQFHYSIVAQIVSLSL